ncbi:Tim44/TimA family putative adaptor protein [Geminicoccaceae bacterium 1502E]|nr:Tim44/TimA family putative adaptor protein [Geminicoccaceae bacterium 1502E]
MSDSFAYLDIIFIAMVAAFIGLRLRSVLGKRTGHERRRPSRIEPQPAPVRGDGESRGDQGRGDNVVPLPDRSPGGRPEDETVLEGVEPAAADGVRAIRAADPSFDPGGFIHGARAAFAMIVEAFAKGEKETLRPLLADDVFASFAAAIDQRQAQGQVLHTELVAVPGAQIVEAGLAGPMSRVTVRFRSEQINATRDAQGTVVEGDAAHVETVVDLWTFERDTGSSDPNWALAETRSGA